MTRILEDVRRLLDALEASPNTQFTVRSDDGTVESVSGSQLLARLDIRRDAAAALLASDAAALRRQHLLEESVGVTPSPAVLAEAERLAEEARRIREPLVAARADLRDRARGTGRYASRSVALPRASESGRRVSTSPFDISLEPRPGSDAEAGICPACGRLHESSRIGKLCGCDAGRVPRRLRAKVRTNWIRPECSERDAVARHMREARAMAAATGHGVEYVEERDELGIWRGVRAAEGRGLEPLLNLADMAARAPRVDDIVARREACRQDAASRSDVLNDINRRCVSDQRREGRTSPRGRRGGRRGRGRKSPN